ncbi:type II toxin-antitoxin system RelE/ParE family toxin [Flammeovirga sp. OC4]|uniref:type II toxin-antitoxin system RelE/ParE family toxin n=1 Tax=Flammeovirga sp. OC4 TaxID=1382345 RepID=UPI0005C4813E|nr:type II toxin-antitoxin system RelE/ParE family toxin [Flammeovirga sp. OC4]
MTEKQFQVRKTEDFDKWLKALKDLKAKGIIIRRLNAIATTGNFGKHKQLKGQKNMFELIIDYGQGYRIYYKMLSGVIVITIGGGIKKDQKKDIKRLSKK